MKNLARQPGTHDKDEEVKAGPLSNRAALKQPANGKSTFGKHRNTNSIQGASGIAAVNKSMDIKPGLGKTAGYLSKDITKEPGSALSKRSSMSG